MSRIVDAPLFVVRVARGAAGVMCMGALMLD